MSVAWPTGKGNTARQRLFGTKSAYSRFWLVVAISGTMALAALAVWLARPTSPAAEIANRMAGEHWYAVAFRRTLVGDYRARNGRTDNGDFEFRTTLRFKLGDNAETYIDDRLIFARAPPHRLQRAEHLVSAGSKQTKVTVAGGTAEVDVDGEARRSPMAVDMRLADYLAVESWLVNDAPAPGDVSTARSVDFERLAIVTDEWRFLARHEHGVEIVKQANGQSTQVRLRPDFVPQRVAVGDVFTLERVAGEAAAQRWRTDTTLFATTAQVVPVDQPIADPEALRYLVLAVDHDLGDTAAWPPKLTSTADTQRPVGASEVARSRAATVGYPADDPRVRALAQLAVAGLDADADKADALTLFVHDHLAYHDSKDMRTVFDTLRDRQGDCTEFADLFTTLSRAVGLPARTIFGLAYQADSQSFAPHAWNEVAIDDVWRSVDPTWGQTHLGATHMALPAGRGLAALAELPHLALRVVETRY